MTQVATASTVQMVRASSAARALNLIGDRWTLLTLYAAFMGETRFDGFVKLTGMPARCWSTGWRFFEEEEFGGGGGRRGGGGGGEGGGGGGEESRLGGGRGAGEASVPGSPRSASRLSPGGDGQGPLRRGPDDPALETRWHYDETSPSHRIEHATCGKPLVAELVCKACERPVEARDVELVPGPGAGLEPAPQARLQRRSTAETARPLTPMLERSIAVLGDRWTAHLLAAAFYGTPAVQRPPAPSWARRPTSWPTDWRG